MNSVTTTGALESAALLGMSENEREFVRELTNKAPVLSIAAKREISKGLGLSPQIKLTHPEGFENGGEVPLVSLSRQVGELAGWVNLYCLRNGGGANAMALIEALTSHIESFSYLAKSNSDMNEVLSQAGFTVREIAHKTRDPITANCLSVNATQQELISEIAEATVSHSPKPAPANVAEFAQPPKTHE